MLYFKRTSNMAEAKTVNFSHVVLFVTSLCLELQSVYCAPTAPVASSFYDRLYQNTSVHNCVFLPQVSKVNYNYTKLQVNRLCDSKIVAKEDVVNQRNSHTSICNSLLEIFPLLCNVQNNSKSVNISTEADLMKIGDLGLKLFCTNLKDITSNISQLTSAKVVPPPWLKESVQESLNSIEEPMCLTLCKNSRFMREEGTDEYTKLDVHPACILLFKGYTIFQQAVVSNQTQSTSKTTLLVSEKTKSDKSSAKAANNDRLTALETNPKPLTVNAVEPIIVPTKQKKQLQQAIMNEITEEVVGTTGSPSESKKDAPPMKQSVVALQNEVTKPSIKQEVPAKPVDKLETASKLSNSENDKNSQQPQSEKPSKTVDQEDKQKSSSVNVKISSSTSSTTTTVAAVDARVNEEPLPMENGNKVKSSTAIPKNANGPASVVSGKVTAIDNKAFSNDEKKQMEEVADITTTGKKKQTQNQSEAKKKSEDADMNMMAELDGEDDGADYNAGEEVDIGMMKPPSVNDDKEVEMPQPETQNQNRVYESDPILKTSKSGFSPNAFREDLDFSRGTTINVSYKESEDTGFFSYFLFCVTLVGLMYLIVHNKKKLIAFVVEGKRPRGRTSRRSSSSSQYRRLENNFD